MDGAKGPLPLPLIALDVSNDALNVEWKVYLEKMIDTSTKR